VVREEDQGDHVRRTVSYRVDVGERVNGYLLIPKPLPKPGERLPLVLCPHPTNMAGKGSVVGVYDKPPADEKERVKRLRGSTPWTWSAAGSSASPRTAPPTASGSC
jgi:hypothetical protein